MGLWFFNDLQAFLGALAAGFTGKIRLIVAVRVD